MQQANPDSPRRRRRWPLIVGAFAILALGVAVIVPRLLDLERYRPRLERALSEATGWRAELGQLDYSWLNGMVLTAEPAKLSDPQGDSTIEIASIRIDAGLASLFRGEIEVRDISLVRPKIHLVLENEGDSWPLPIGGGSTAPDVAPKPDASSSPLTVSIDRVRLKDASLRLEDRSGPVPVEFALERVDADLDVESLNLTIAGAIAENGGTFRGGGNPDNDGLKLQLEQIRTEALEPFLGPDLLRPGGRLDGTMNVAFPLRITADLEAQDILLLTGDQALERSTVQFEIADVEDLLQLRSFSLVSGEARLSGEGSLSPELDLNFRLADAPIEEVVRASRALFPFPLEFESPGRGEASARIRTPQGGQTQVEAQGKLSAAGFELAEYLPKARDLKTDFKLSPAGDLAVRILEGNIAGGPLRGTARLDSVDTPGTLAFDGSIQETPLGALLAGFINRAEETIGGPSALTAGLRLNLSNPEIDYRSLGGSIALDSRDVTLPGWDLERAIALELRKRIGAYGEVARKLDPKIAAKLDELELRAGSGAEQGARKVAELVRKLDVKVGFDTLPWKLERLAFDGDAFQADGSGSFSPENGGVKLRMTARFSPEKSLELVKKYDALKPLVKDGRLTLPMLVEGPMTSPAIGVDLGGVIEGWIGVDLADPKKSVKGLLRGLVDRELDKRKEKTPPPSEQDKNRP